MTPPIPRLSGGRPKLRLAVVSPFLDRQHGTERCIIEQIERFVRQNRWTIELYSQRISQLEGVIPASKAPANASESIIWHKVSDVGGPHLLKYVWWFFANQWRRRSDHRSGRVLSDLLYSPGINCSDADVIVVHIVFHAFYEQVRTQLALARAPLRTWPLILHRKIYYRLIMQLERRIYRNPKTQLIAVSQLVATQLQSYFQRGDAVVIPNAVDTGQFNPQKRIARRDACRTGFGYSHTAFVLLLIGNDLKKKGLETLLRALAQLAAIPFSALVVTNDDTRMFAPLLAQPVFHDRVRFAKPSPDVLSFYAAADLYVGPSLEDAFNLPILEAMAAGLPVITSSRAGAAELIRDGETGLILKDPQDHAQLAALIGRVYANEVLRHALGENASIKIQKNCSWDQNAEETARFLERALQKSRDR